MSSKIIGLVIIPSKKGMIGQCKCGYKWTYSGIRVYSLPVQSVIDYHFETKTKTTAN